MSARHKLSSVAATTLDLALTRPIVASGFFLTGNGGVLPSASAKGVIVVRAIIAPFLLSTAALPVHTVAGIVVVGPL